MPADVNASESILSTGEGGKHLLTPAADVYGSRVARETILQRAKVGSHRVGVEPPGDPVQHPPHYTAHPMECIQLIEMLAPAYAAAHPLAPFYAGTVIKYLYRAPHKGSCKQDLQKACWYLNRLVESMT